MDEKEKLKIDNLRDDKKIFWAIFVVLNGGLACILLSLDGFHFTLNFFIKAIFIILGALTWYGVLIRLMYITKRINKYWE
jgi:hypothetical protein